MTSSTSTPSGGLEARPPATQRERSPAEIEAEIERTRTRLAGTVNAIADRVKPANVARRTVESAKAQVVDGQGQLRPDRVAALAVTVAVTIGLLIRRRSR